MNMTEFIKNQLSCFQNMFVMVGTYSYMILSIGVRLKGCHDPRLVYYFCIIFVLVYKSLLLKQLIILKP